MPYDPLYDVARQVTDEQFGPGSYARINAGNPGIPAELRKKLQAELKPADPPKEVDAE